MFYTAVVQYKTHISYRKYSTGGLAVALFMLISVFADWGLL